MPRIEQYTPTEDRDLDDTHRRIDELQAMVEDLRLRVNTHDRVDDIRQWRRDLTSLRSEARLANTKMLRLNLLRSFDRLLAKMKEF